MFRKRSTAELMTLVRLALIDFSDNNCQYLAAGIAYWALFSLFPLALATLSIAGFLYPSGPSQAELVASLVAMLPVSEGFVTEMISEVTNARGTLGFLSIVGLLWTGMAVFSAIRKAVNHAWHIGRPPYFLVERAVDLLMLLGLAAMVFLGAIFTSTLAWAWAASSSIGAVLNHPVIKVCTGILAFSVTWGMLSLLYRYLPNGHVEWGDVMLGSLAGAVAFQAVQVALSASIAGISSLNLIYGSLSSLMAVMLWAYLSSLALVSGAVLSFVYSRLWGSGKGLGFPPRLQAEVERGAGAEPFRARMVLRWLWPPWQHK